MNTSEKMWAFDIHVELFLSEMEDIIEFGGSPGIVTQDKIEKILASYVTEKARFETKRVHDDDTCPFMWDEPHACFHTKEIRS